MNKAVTLKDIAERLNMSISTVSKALSNDPNISIATKERVLKKAAEWHYVPNESARHFKLNKTFTIGLIIPDLLDQFYILAVNGVEDVAARENYNLILTQSHEIIAKENQIISVMIKNRVDGIIITITKNTVDMASFEKLWSIGIPVVCMAREPQNQSINYVCTNNKEAAFKATSFLIKKKHKRIAHIMGPEALQVSQQRLDGYKVALTKYNIPIEKELVKQVDLTSDATVKAVDELMKMKDPPTGIFAFKNYITLDAINFLKRKYPESLDKVDFVGFGNLPLINYLDHKPLASIDESSYEMGQASARLLFEMIKNDNQTDSDPQKIEIPCKLIIHSK